MKVLKSEDAYELEKEINDYLSERFTRENNGGVGARWSLYKIYCTDEHVAWLQENYPVANA
jgi:hypothetical protein